MRHPRCNVCRGRIWKRAGRIREPGDSVGGGGVSGGKIAQSEMGEDRKSTVLGLGQIVGLSQP